MGRSSSPPHRVSRRDFLALTGVAAVGLLVGCAEGGSDPIEGATTSNVTVFRRSSRGKRASRATRRHNANKLFETRADALAGLAHPGDRSEVVEVTISRERFEDLFRSPRRSVVDLRSL